MPIEIGRVALESIPPGTMRKLARPPFNVLLVNVAGELFAIEDGCPHSGWSLSEGTLDGCVITCRGHGWVIDVRTGAVVAPPVDEHNPSFRVEIEGSDAIVYED